MIIMIILNIYIIWHNIYIYTYMRVCVCMIPSHPFPYEIPCFRDTDSWGFILNQCLAMFFLSLPYGFFTPERWTLGIYKFKGSKPRIGTQWRTLHKQETWDLEEMMKNGKNLQIQCLDPPQFLSISGTIADGLYMFIPHSAQLLHRSPVSWLK